MEANLSLGSIGLALLFGLLSFISPCVLPLVPAYLSYISGHTFEELTGKERRVQVILTTLGSAAVFCLGFTTVFLAMGVTATQLGAWLQSHRMLFNHVAGIVLIIFGLHMAGVFQLKFLLGERRFEGKKGRWGLLGTFVVGLAFAFGWTPCIGPFLAGLLFLASNQNTVGQGFFLLLVYSLGLAVPFLAAAVAVNTFLAAFQRVKRHFRTIEIIGGILLIEFGHIIFFNKLGWLAGKLGFVNLGF